MKYTKQQCRDAAKHDYIYGGYWNDRYHYSKRIPWPGTGYLVIEADSIDFTNGNLEFFFKNDISRNKD